MVAFFLNSIAGL